MKKLLLLLFLLINQLHYSTPMDDISIVGTALNGWEEDVHMNGITTSSQYSLSITLQVGELKFRQYKDWNINWGGDTFPEGTGVLDGENISINTPGLYYISFDKETGKYSFILECGPCEQFDGPPVCANGITYDNSCMAECAGFTNWSEKSCSEQEKTVAINGTSIGKKTYLSQGPKYGLANFDPDIYESILTLDEGQLYFELSEKGITSLLGASDFPNGKAVKESSNQIKVPAGNYVVSFNTQDNSYSIFPSFQISVAGHQLKQVGNSSIYQVDHITLYDPYVEIISHHYTSDIQFKEIFSLNDSNFNKNAPFSPGEYTISYNKVTNAYTFEKTCICPEIYAPVCVNGITYSNACQAKCAGATTWFDLPCESTQKQIILKSKTNPELNIHLSQPNGGIYMNSEYVTGQGWIDTGDYYFEINLTDNKEEQYTYILSDDSFPMGTATQDFTSYISIPKGSYQIIYNTYSNEYNFESTTQVSCANQPLMPLNKSGDYYAENVKLTDQNLIFNVSGHMVVSQLYGEEFPSGLAQYDSNLEDKGVQIPNGTYSITYNINTHYYKFENFKSTDNKIHLFGNATAAPINLIYIDGHYIAKAAELKKGALFFGGVIEKDMAFEMGGNTYPTGIAQLNATQGIQIPKDGKYDIKFTYLGLENSTYEIKPTTLSNNSYLIKSLNIYPNPTTDGIVYFSEKLDVQLYNSNGLLLLDETQIKSISISHLPNGMYILKGMINNEPLTYKLIKK